MKGVQFLTDKRGRRIAAVIALKDYKKMLEKMEDLEDICAYDAAKASREKLIPYDKAAARIGRRRQ